MMAKTEPCIYCGFIHGLKCPMVKAFEYFENGMVKRVEFFAPGESGVLTAGEKIYFPSLYPPNTAGFGP